MTTEQALTTDEPYALPWERMPKESNPAWEAFRVYRDMPPGTRSQISVGIELGKSGALMNRWSAEHQWVARARAYDMHNDRIRRNAQESALAEMAGRHARQAATLARALLIPAEQLLEEMERDGQTILDALHDVPIEERLRLIARTGSAFSQVMKAERLASGASTENVEEHTSGAIEHTIKPGESVTDYLREIAELDSASDFAEADE